MNEAQKSEGDSDEPGINAGPFKMPRHRRHQLKETLRLILELMVCFHAFRTKLALRFFARVGSSKHPNLVDLARQLVRYECRSADATRSLIDNDVFRPTQSNGKENGDNAGAYRDDDPNPARHDSTKVANAIRTVSI